MAVKIRLARAGAKKAPFYRVVAADSRAPRDGRFIEILGRYNPRTEPSLIELDIEKVDAWLAKGAEPTETAARLIAIVKNPQAAAPAKEAPLSKKAQAKVEADKKAAADAAAKAAEAERESAEKAAEGDRAVIDEDLGESVEIPAEEPVREAAEAAVEGETEVIEADLAAAEASDEEAAE